MAKKSWLSNIIGQSAQGSVNQPIKINSVGEMYQHFGRPEPEWLPYLAYLLRATPELPWSHARPRRWRPATRVPGDPGRLSAVEINTLTGRAIAEGLGEREIIAIRYAFALETDDGAILLIRRWGTSVSTSDPKPSDLCEAEGEVALVLAADEGHPGIPIKEAGWLAEPVKLRKLRVIELIENLVEADLP